MMSAGFQDEGNNVLPAGLTASADVAIPLLGLPSTPATIIVAPASNDSAASTVTIMVRWVAASSCLRFAQGVRQLMFPRGDGQLVFAGAAAIYEPANVGSAGG